MMVRGGLQRIRNQINTDMDKGQMGTGTTLENVQDTALQTAVSETELDLTATTTDRMLEKTLTVPSTLGNGNTLSEVFLKKSTATSKGYSHITFSGIAKTNLFEIRSRSRYVILGIEDA